METPDQHEGVSTLVSIQGGETDLYQIVEYFNFNPRATAMEAIGHMEKELDIGTQVQYIKDEVKTVTRLRLDIRPLQGQRRDIEEKMKYVISDLGVAVMLKYPPRQGTKEDRDKELEILKEASSDYRLLLGQLQQVTEQIAELETELYTMDQNAKNARRLVELFEAYVKFVTQFKKV